MSLTVLQGVRGTVHRLALGRSSALGAGHRVVAMDAAAEAAAQLQAPHVADHGRCIKGLLCKKTNSGDKIQHQQQVQIETNHFLSEYLSFCLKSLFLVIGRDDILCSHPPFAFGKVFPHLSAD